jgi:hypothetical protein
MKPIKKIVDCPGCGEGDERHFGINVCGLCECRFWVRAGRPVFVPATAKRIPQESDR